MSFYVLKKTARPPAPVSPANPDWKSSSCLHHFPSWWVNFMPSLEVLSRNKGLFLLQIISQYCALSIKMWWAALGIIIYIASLNAAGRARAEAATPKPKKPKQSKIPGPVSTDFWTPGKSLLSTRSLKFLWFCLGGAQECWFLWEMWFRARLLWSGITKKHEGMTVLYYRHRKCGRKNEKIFISPQSNYWHASRNAAWE